jgi:uncharacterized protein (TIGR00251 family)
MSTTIQVKAKPGAKVSQLDEPGADGIWRAQLKSPPVDGRANAELIALVAAHFGVRKADVEIRSGAGAKLKLVRVAN